MLAGPGRVLPFPGIAGPPGGEPDLDVVEDGDHDRRWAL